MKNINQITGIVLLAVFLVGCASSRQAPVKYERLPDGNSTILKGVISRQVLNNDSSYKWLEENMKYGTADAAAVEAFQQNKNQFTMLVFGGTWCEDSQHMLPVFYRLVDKSGYPDSRITLVAVDRAKTAPDDLHIKYKVDRVPTFIVLHKGEEVGRVVEYGKEGKIDKELGDIVRSIGSK